MKKILLNTITIAMMLFIIATFMFAIVGEVPTSFKVILVALTVLGIVIGLFEKKVVDFLEKNRR